MPAVTVALLAAVLFVGSLIQASEASGAEPDRMGNDTPIVLIVLDELPTASLMTRDGKAINKRRFPNIASLAGDASWYPDHTTVGDFTAWAVPSILSGGSGDMYTLPTVDEYPENIFTLFGPGRRLHALEPLTELCPASLCPGGGQGQVTGAKHAVDFIKAKFRPFEPRGVNQWIAGLPAGRGTLSVAHIESPHLPLRFLPDGKTYPGGPLAMPTDLKVDPWTVGESGAAFVQQRHLLQAGYADRLVGKILRKVVANGDYQDAMIVLTADHGVSYDPADLRRDATATNVGATLNPPLIIKYPGQTGPLVSDRATQSIDILPTIAKTLGANAPAAGGMPADEVPGGRSTVVNRYYQSPLEFTVDEMKADRAGVLRVQYSRLGNGPLWKLGPRSDLIGTRPVARRALAPGAASLDFPQRLNRADYSDQVVPSLVSGKLRGVGKNRILALTWNGKVVATTRTFKFKGGSRFGFMVRPDVMRRGKNRIGLYLSIANQLRRITIR